MYDQTHYFTEKYILNQSGYQLKLPLNLETIIPKDDSVRLLSQFVEAMDLTDLHSTYERMNSVCSGTLLKIVLYPSPNGTIEIKGSILEDFYIQEYCYCDTIYV